MPEGSSTSWPGDRSTPWKAAWVAVGVTGPPERHFRCQSSSDTAYSPLPRSAWCCCRHSALAGADGGGGDGGGGGGGGGGDGIGQPDRPGYPDPWPDRRGV